MAGSEPCNQGERLVSYNKDKHLSGLHLIKALEDLAVAYYHYSDHNTLEAMQHTRNEIERRLAEWSSFPEEEKDHA